MTYVFDEFELDADRAELRRNGEPLHIEPQVFDLLKLLVSARDRVVTKDEMFQEIWGDRIVSDAALSSRIKDARKVLGDDGSAQKFIKTIQRRGLRFVGNAVETGAKPSAVIAPTGTVQASAATEDPFDRPSVAVLPFSVASADPNAQALAQGVTDELSAALSAWRFFPVISSTSTRRFASSLESAREIGAALHARYLLEGSFRKQGERLKIQVTLTDADTEAQIWADRIICDQSDLFDLEEELAARIATIVAPELEGAEARRVVRKPPDDMTAWELAMRAAWLINRRSASELIAAEQLATRAAEKSPDWVLPYTLIAVSRFQQAMTGFSKADSATAFRPTLDAAESALEIDPNAWMAQALTGVGHLWTNRNHERAKLHVAKAIQLNPSAAMNYHFGRCVFGFAGDPAQACAYQERLFRVDPVYHHRAVIEADLGLWHLLEEEFETSADYLRKSQFWNPSYGRAWQRQIALSGLTGDTVAANEAAQRLSELGMTLNIDVIAASYPFRERRHHDLFYDGLRKSGVDM